MADLLQTHIIVEADSDVFNFRIPSFRDEIALNLKERSIRVAIEREVLNDDQPVTGAPTGDPGADFYVRTAAIFAQQLESGPAWVYSPDKVGLPRAEYSNWPPHKVNIALNVAMDFENQLRRFRSGGAADNEQHGSQVVEGQSNTGNEPLQQGNAGS